MSSLSESDDLVSPAEEQTQPMSNRANAAAEFGPLDATLAPPMRIRFPDPATSVLSLDGLPAGPETTPAPRSQLQMRLPQLPGYEVLGELGRGGMGVVYRARQVRLNRFVALKMLLEAEHADLSDVVRFRSEAEAVAAVRHPHVVQVHEFGHFEGKPYFAMEFLPGGTLHNRIRTMSALAPRNAAELTEKLARAVQAAHAQGIVHRDLKPGNVLFDESGEPRITDFGLAKRVSLQLTQTQAVMGTPAYMSPEQAVGRAKFVGPPTDIYALGVILYECLTGRPPFAGEDSISVIQQVLNDTPKSIRSQVPDVPRDLELICLKCLEKEQHDRYATAAALAEDLGRYLAGEPVLVRPAGPIERGIKWARRRPTMATVYALALLVCLVTSVGLGMFGLWRSALVAKADADEQRREAELARDRVALHNTEIEQKNLEVEGALTREQSASAEAQRSADAAREATAKAEASKESLETLAYFRNVAFANLEMRQGNVVRARQLLDLCPPARRDWEWWHAYRVAHEDTGSGSTNTFVTDIAFTGRDIDVTTVDEQGIITPFEMDRGLNTPKPMLKEKPCFTVHCRFSSDAARLLTAPYCPVKGGDLATIWDTKTGKALHTIPHTGQPVVSAAISGNGQVVLIAYAPMLPPKEGGAPPPSPPARVVAYDARTGKERATLPGFSSATRIALNGDGSRALTVQSDLEKQPKNIDAVVWDTDTGEVLWRRNHPGIHPGCMAMDAAGARVAVGCHSGLLTLSDIATNKTIEIEKAHLGDILALAVSRDGKRVASSGEDGIVKIWNAQTGAVEHQLRGHTKRVVCVAFDATGQFVSSSDAALRFFIWDLQGTKQAIIRVAPPPAMKGTFVADRAGSRCFSFGEGGSPHYWDLKPNKLYPQPSRPNTRFTAFAFAPNGTQYAAGTDVNTVHLWDGVGTVAVDLPQLGDAKSYQQMATWGVKIEAVIFSGDGSKLLVSDGWRLAVYDTKTHQKLFAQEMRHAASCISDDGNTVAASWHREATVWNWSTKATHKCDTEANDWISSLALTPKGDTLAAGKKDWSISLFDLKKSDAKTLQQPTRRLDGHCAGVGSLAFHPKAHRLVSGADDGAIKVWDTASGHEAIGITAISREVIHSVFFTNSGNEIIATMGNLPPFVFHGGNRPTVIPPRN